MRKFISFEEKNKLIESHKSEKNRKKADRIKAVLLSNDGWSHRAIAKVLLLDEETISRHVNEYKEKKKLSNNSGGANNRLLDNNKDTIDLISHLHKNTYLTARDIIKYVEMTYAVSYTQSGMVSWLHNNGFSYKKPQRQPSKAEQSEQEKFKKSYFALKSTLSPDDIILFGDGVHPTMQTKITEGWIKTGFDKPIKTTASRTRVNLFGVIDLDTMDIITDNYKTIDSDSISIFLEKLKFRYNDKKKIHLMLDQGPYNKSKATLKKAKELGITIHLLPTYSPNLNPIERLWKLANKYVRNNTFFKNAKDFKKKILEFYDETWLKIKSGARKTINDNFQTLNFDILK